MWFSESRASARYIFSDIHTALYSVFGVMSSSGDSRTSYPTVPIHLPLILLRNRGRFLETKAGVHLRNSKMRYTSEIPPTFLNILH